jgi:predicted nucleic acid-binding Zn ribbon protein
MREIKKNCLHCGREFVKTGNSQKYCSDCGSGYHRKYEELESATCKECGKEFSPSCPTMIYCSKECARNWHNRARAMKRKENKRYCVVCGALLTDYKHRRYCSEECKKKANRIKVFRPKRKAKKMASLIDISAKANEEGLTYGQYVAKYGL